MNEFEKSVDEIALGAIEALKIPEIDFEEREFAVNLLENCLNYFKRQIRKKDGS